jgi:8-oxo-dGTP pyrophosphatase MutT (NUDIX family)
LDLEQYEKLGEPLREVTLCFLVREGEILLAMKKKGFGVGKLNGLGGKVEPGESIEEGAIREVQEEAGVTPTSMRKVADMRFFFDGVSPEKKWNQKGTIFLVDAWEGEPHETDEMKPEWFSTSEIPYDRMWPDDIYWIPEILKGKKLNANFLFDSSQKLVEFRIEEQGKHSQVQKPGDGVHPL